MKKDLVKYLKTARNIELATVQSLISDGADVNVLSDGMSPLMLACQKNLNEIVSEILMSGADANLQDKKSGCTAIMFAIMNGNIDIVKRFISFGTDINIKEAIEQAESQRKLWNQGVFTNIRLGEIIELLKEYEKIKSFEKSMSKTVPDFSFTI